MSAAPRPLPPAEAYPFAYSVCTLVTRHEEYAQMHASFVAAGFGADSTEYLYIDNSQANAAEAYGGLNRFLRLARGRYIILCHQDILLSYDTRADLEARMAELDVLDPRWAVLSNAGAQGVKRKVIRCTGADGVTQTVGSFPAQVRSVDEAFMLVKSEANLALSADLAGFHLYGTDLCLVAERLGYTAYVVRFNLLHKSNGTLSADFYAARAAFIQKHARTRPLGYVQTTCTLMHVSPSPARSWFFNLKPVMLLARTWHSLLGKLVGRPRQQLEQL